MDKADSDPSQVSEYSYEPLPDAECIRLLELNPGKGSIISCQLRPVPLGSAAGSYEAVSYCWGDPNKAVDILVDDKRLTITVNLYDALCHLRHESEPRILWADAICIHQKNKDDQGQHVRRMGKIYEYASSVPVWLGLDDLKIADDCFRLVTETARSSRDLIAKYGSPVAIPKPLPDNPICQDASKYQMVTTLVNLPWFGRVWVLQEVGLATKCVFLYGAATMNVGDLVELGMFIWVRGDLFPSPDSSVFKVLDTFASIWSSYTSIISWKNDLSPSLVTLSVGEQRGSFAEILHTGRRFQATDAKDYVYAFLGHPKAVDPETDGPLVYVDYHKTLHDVYYEAAHVLLKVSDLTFLLACVDRDQKALEESFPSWVPQWHLAKNVTAYGFPGEWYRAGGESQDLKYTLLGDRSLKLRGIIFDEIHWTAASSMTAADFDTSATSPRARQALVPQSVWQELVRQNLGSKYGGEGRLDALLLTLLAGRSKAEDRVVQHRADFWAYCIAIGASINDNTPEEQTRHAQNGAAWRYERDAMWACEGRRFFCTKSGYYGLGHKLVRQGDVCCIFMGARVPFILRPTSQSPRYKLVGDSYIHGVSKGEILVDSISVEEDIILA